MPPSLDAAVEAAPLVLRYDDYNHLGGAVEEVERTLLGILEHHGLRAVFSVIPEDLDTNPAKIDLLRGYVARQTVEVALHGRDHRIRGGPETTVLSRTAVSGLDYEEQLDRISRGKQMLEVWFDTSIRAFVPPWNSYDANTLRACAVTGLDVVSADVWGPCEAPSDLHLLPTTVRLADVPGLLTRWERPGNADRTAVVMFHAFDFVESGDARGVHTLDWFESVAANIAWHGAVESSTLSAVAKRFAGRLTLERYASAQRAYRQARAVYASRLQTRVGRFLGVPGNLDVAGYETAPFYRAEWKKQRLLRSVVPSGLRPAGSG